MGSEDFVARIRAEINMSGVQSQLDSLTNKIEFQLSKAFSSVKIKIDTDAIARQFQSLGVSVGKTLSESISVGLGSVKSASLGDSISNSLQSGVDKGTASIKKLASAATKAIDSGRIDASVAKVNASWEKLGATGHDSLETVKSDIKQLESLQEKLHSGISGKDLASTYKEFSTVLERVRNNLQQISAESKTMATNLQIDTLDNQISTWFDKNASAAQSFSSEISTLRSQLADMRVNGGMTSDFLKIESQFKSIQQQVSATTSKLAESATKALNTGSIDSAISKVKLQFEQLGTTGHSSLQLVGNDIQRLVELSNSMRSSTASPEELAASYSSFNETLARVRNTLSQILAESKTTASSLQISTLDNQMATWLEKNSKAAKQFGTDIANLRAQLSGINGKTGNLGEFQKIESQFKSIQQQAIATGQTGQTLASTFKNSLSSITQYFSAIMLLHRAVATFKKMYTAVYDVNTAMTELKKVTEESASAYESFLSGAGTTAKEIGTTIKDYVNSTADFARLGFSFDDSQELAKVASVYSVVGDGINGIDDATQHIISTMTAFRKEGDAFASSSDFALSIVDKYNEVGNNFAITSGDIGEALERSASSFAASNNTLDESIALITAANTVVQNPENVGTAFKTLTMRIRGAKTELTEAGLETDGMATSTSKLREQILALSGVDIMKDKNTFKSTYDILDELSQKWQDLTDIQQASILETIAGKRAGNVVSSLLNNFDIAREALEAASNSEGSAMTEHERWMESLEARTNQFKASFEELSQVTLDSDFLGSAIDTGTQFLSILTSIVDKVGPLPVLISAVATSLSLFKNVGVFSTIDSGLNGISNHLSLMKVSLSDLSSVFRSSYSSSGGGISGFFSALGSTKNVLSSGITSKDISNIKAYNDAIDSGVTSQTAWYRTMQDSSDAAKTLVENANGGQVALESLGDGAKGAAVGLTASKVAATALDMALSMGLSIAIQAAITGFKHLIYAAKEASEAADEQAEKSSQAFSTAQEEASQIDSLIAKYKELSVSDTQDSSTRSEIADIQSQIVSLVGSQASNLDLVNGKLDEEIAKLDIISGKQGDVVTSNAVTAYQDAVEASEKIVGPVGGELWDLGRTWDYRGKDDPKAREILSNSGANYYWDRYLTGDINIETRGNAYNRVVELDKMISALESDAEYNYSASDVYNALVKARSYYQEYDDKVTSAARSLLDSVINSSIGDISDDGVNSLESYEDYRNRVIEALGENKDLKSVLDRNDISQEDLEERVDSYLGTLDKFSAYYDQWKSKISKEDSLAFLKEKFGEEAIGDLEKYSASALESITKYINDNPDATLDEAKNIASLRDGLLGLAQSYLDVAAAKSAYNEELEVGSKDTDYKDFADAYSAIQGEIENNRTNSTEYNAAAKLLLGEKTLEDLQWDTDKINARIQQLSTVFGDADNSGYGLIQTLSGIAEQGKIIGENGDLLASITTNEDGTLSLDVVADKFDELAEKTGMSEEALKACYEALGNFENINFYDLDKVKEGLEQFSYSTVTKDEVTKKLEQLSAGGNVDLTNRPQVATSELSKKGWKNVGDGYATVFTSTYSNEEGTKAINFTPILVDENGKYQGVLTEQELEDYANGVINGGEDYKNLQIGAEFTGTDALEQAEKTAELIHDLHEFYYEGGDATELAKKILSYDDMMGVTTEGLEKSYVGFDTFKEKLNSLGIEGREVYDIMRSLEESGGIEIFSVDDDLDTIKSSLQDLNILQEGENGGYNLLADDFFDFANTIGLTTDDTVELIEKLSELDGIDFTDAEGNVLDFSEAINKAYESVINHDLSQKLKQSYEDFAQEAADAGQSVEEHYTQLMGLEGLESEFTIDVSSIESTEEKVEALEKTIDSLSFQKEFELSPDQLNATNALLGEALRQKQKLTEPTIMKVDASQVGAVDATVGDAVSQLQSFVALSNELDIQIKTGADTSDIQATQEKLKAVATQLDSLPEDTKVKLGIDASNEEFTAAIENIKDTEVNVQAGVELDQADITAVQTAISGISADQIELATNSDTIVLQLNGVADAANAIPETVDISVSAATSTAVSNLKAVSTALAPIQSRSITITVTKKYITEGSNASGTAHASGTAKRGGDWRVGYDSTSLVGELGPELVVRDGRYFTVGDSSAEFVQLKKNDIVFNAEQTRQILKNGKITNGAKRGISYADGNVGKNGVFVLTIPNWNSAGNRVQYTSNSYSNDDEEPEEIDFIETALDRVERAIDKVGKKAEDVNRHIGTRLEATGEQISAITEEIEMQSEAYDRYMYEADSVGLSESLAQKVRDGLIDIQEYDDDTRDLISSYQDWYEKALDCSDAIDELHTTVAELYKDAFDNSQAYFQSFLDQYEHAANMYEAQIDEYEALGYQVSKKFYEQIIDETQKTVDVSRQAFGELGDALSAAVSSGEIDEYSETWFDMVNELNDLEESIANSNVEIIKFKKEIRELSWDNFDFIIDRIEQLNDEAEFFIDLMDDRDLFDDKGAFTEFGTATAGLHVEKYNVYMSQAKKYAEELLEVQEALADDPFDTKLIERKEELYEAQRKNILAAKDEKDAIVDLVEEGIDLELDALDKLIEKYKDALDNNKDLYDYQKNIDSQTADVAKLQKQLLAYENDNSEETRATVQKLKSDLKEAQSNLEETQYDKYISDQKSMLDEFYNDYEEALNRRLDDIDGLLVDITSAVNESSAEISETINGMAESVGYVITSEMGSVFGDKTVPDQVEQVIAAIKETYAIKEEQEETPAETSAEPAAMETAKSNETPQNMQPVKDEPSNENISVGSTINAGNAMIYATSYGEGGSRQYFSDDPIYTVIGESNGFLKVRHHSSSSGVTGWFRKSDVKAYKKGGLIDYTGLAWVDGSPNNPEYVLNAETTKRLMNLSSAARAMSESPLSITGSNLFDFGVGSIYQSVFSNITKDLSNIIDRAPMSYGDVTVSNEINIPIDHVEDYDDFVTKMQNDRKFNDMILSMTIDQLGGNSAMKKYKYKW